ncbi:hypothetical protein SAMN04487926_101484 [Paraburkholderia steynii]|uniref:Uncharacterized protein n=1 Tax=Paraburkholderia steynii TaxID=1245441 RepID=A0A7Z7B0D6_9BURK|nr:hypothetical protein [Paraburkholderia steynii]SDG97696.1 hypothetical protein SAMN04487926_101484 [Paraburkholderia steynii]
MLDQLLDVLGNSHFEAYLGGPLVGLILGAILNSLGKRPGPENRGHSLQDARHQLDQHRERREQKSIVDHHHYHHSGTGTGGDTSLPVAFFGLVLLAVALVMFAAYLPQLAGTLYFVTTAIAMCSLTAAVLACVTGRFNTREWWMQAVFPATVSLGCFWLTLQAQQAIRPDVVAFAQELLADQPVSFGMLVRAAVRFTKSVGSEYVQWMMFDMMAFVCVIACAVIALLRLAYYVSLSNARDGGAGIWLSLALRTEPFAGRGGAVFVVAMFTFGTLLATGRFYYLVHNIPGLA